MAEKLKNKEEEGIEVNGNDYLFCGLELRVPVCVCVCVCVHVYVCVCVCVCVLHRNLQRKRKGGECDPPGPSQRESSYVSIQGNLSVLKKPRIEKRDMPWSLR